MRCDYDRLSVEHSPHRKVKVSFNATWDDNKVVFLTALSGRGLANGIVIIEHMEVDSQSLKRDDPIFEPNQRRHITLRGAVSRSGLEEVERGRGDNDVKLTFEFTSTVVLAIPQPIEGDEPVYVGGRPFWNTAWSPDNVFVPRSDWLRHLKEFGHGEVELFELPVAALRGDPPFQAAVGHLRDAEAAFRSGQYDTTLFKCRKAVESMARHAATGDLKNGFELALIEAFGTDATRIKVFDRVLLALSEMDHVLGRHEQYPPVTVTRQEAEFALSAHVRLLSMLGGLIAERKRRAGLTAAAG